MIAAVPVRSERPSEIPAAASACSMEKKQTTRSGRSPTGVAARGEVQADPPGEAGQPAGGAGAGQAPARPTERRRVDEAGQVLALEVGHGRGQVAEDQPVAADLAEHRDGLAAEIGVRPARARDRVGEALDGELPEPELELRHREGAVARPEPGACTGELEGEPPAAQQAPDREP